MRRVKAEVVAARAILIFGVMVAVILLMAGRAHATPVEEGLAWLKASQSAEGHWGIA